MQPLVLVSNHVHATCIVGLFTHYFLPTGTVGPILSLYETAEPLTRDEFERRRALAEYGYVESQLVTC